MGSEQKEAEAAFRRGWDCGSELYDSVELASVYRVLDRHLMTPPHARGSAEAAPSNGVMERSQSRRRTALAKTTKGSRRSKALRKTGTAVLRSVFRSVTCSRRL
uniref:Uncharacterized protein n=1 Tax=Avena sativa TaxID=4498 RepID=A0ACD5TDE7_AVESA